MNASIYSIVTYNILTTIEDGRDLNEPTSMIKEETIVPILRRRIGGKLGYEWLGTKCGLSRPIESNK